ncbi:MAG TPA: hypothetical protein VEL82_08110 [Thermoplasmata archaeon]|nr:hypothetical protein [Thermoplasmata archaeon]
MIAEPLGPGRALLLVGAVRGLESESPRVLAAVDGHAPTAVGIGLSTEEVASLRRYFVASDAEPVVPLTSNETGEVRGLSRFGRVRVPNPSFIDLIAWADERALPIEALDPSEDASAEMFAEHIGYVELVRRTVRERSTGRNPPAPSSPDEFALAWDQSVAGGRGSRAFARSRDGHLVRGARRLAQGRGRIAVVVDRERFPLVRELLTGREPERLGDP